METWKDIEGYPGYQVSDLGRVRTHNKVTSNKRYDKRLWKDRILKNKVSKKDNCSRVSLWKNGVEKDHLVHRLEAVAFLGEPSDKDMTVNHKDGNRQNNSVDNLEWLSRADNIRHGFATGLYKRTHKPCALIDSCGCVTEFPSLAAAGRYINRDSQYLSTRTKRGYKTVIGADGRVYNVVLRGNK